MKMFSHLSSVQYEDYESVNREVLKKQLKFQSIT